MAATCKTGRYTRSRTNMGLLETLTSLQIRLKGQPAACDRLSSCQDDILRMDLTW